MTDEQHLDGERSLRRESPKPGPDTVTKLVHRLRALTLHLLPIQVKLESIKEPTSKIITPEVISSYMASAGDFLEVLPFALLRARQTFIWDARHNMADWDENMGRATACEVLARRILHSIGPDRLTDVVNMRFRYREADGDVSNPASALEYAIDKYCIIFLSSSESQDVVNSIWTGKWVQVYDDQEAIYYVPYEETRKSGFWSHFDPARLSVPRYQNIFRIAVWLFFLFTYSQAVQQPLVRLGPRNQGFDVWEYILYIMALAFTFEDIHRLYTKVRLFEWRVGFMSFWTIISLITDALLVTAFVLRILGIVTDDSSGSKHLRSFQVLSCVAPLIWMKIITVFDGAKYVGTTQICVARMLQESTLFFSLLALLLAGFFQGMVALDASDGETGSRGVIISSLVQALLQSPNFDKAGTNAYGFILYYFWSFATTVILLNILISLFASAYQDVVDDAEAQYLAFFAGKTIGMIRAPDKYVYPPPFNILEMVFLVPWEFILSKKKYAKLNKYAMVMLFFVPLTVIALFESRLRVKDSYIRNWFDSGGLGDEDSPEARDPQIDDENGLQISKVEFKELIKVFPNVTQSSDVFIIREIQELRHKIDESRRNTDK